MPNTTDVVSSNPAQARCRTLRDKVCQWHAAGRWCSPGTPVSSTNKTDRHDITEIFLKVALNTIKPKAWNTLCKIKEFFKPTVLTLLHVRLRILLTRGKHLHYRIIWILGEVYIHKTSHFLLPVPSQISERSCICESRLSLSIIFWLDFGIVQRVWHFFFHFMVTLYVDYNYLTVWRWNIWKR